MLFWKNVPSGLLLKIGWRFKVIYLLMYVNAIVQGSFVPASKGVLMALWHFPTVIGLRMQIQRRRRRSAEYIDSMLYQDLPPNQKGKLRKLVRAR
jgi:hypothetical protein